MNFGGAIKRGGLSETDLAGLSRKQLDYLLAKVAGTRYSGDVDPEPLEQLVKLATAHDLSLIYKMSILKKASGSLVSSPFNMEDRAVRDGNECRYVKFNAAHSQISPPFVEVCSPLVVAPVPIKEYMFEPKQEPAYNPILHGELTSEKLTANPRMSQDMVRAAVCVVDDEGMQFHELGAYVYEEGTPKTPAQLAFMLAAYTKLEKGQIIMGAPTTAFVKLGIKAVSSSGIMTAANLLTGICKSFLDKLAAAKQVTMKGRPFVDWLYSIFKGLPRSELAALSHTVFSVMFPQCFVEKTDQHGAAYSGAFTKEGAKYFKNCSPLAKDAAIVLKVQPHEKDMLVVPVMAASIPCPQTVPKLRNSFMEAYKFLSSSRALRSEDDKLMSGLTQGYNGSGCPSRSLARIRTIVKIVLANTVRQTFLRIESKYIIPVASSISRFRPELCPLLFFDSDPVSSLIEKYNINMRPGLGSWKGDVIDLIGEPQSAASTKKDDWDRAARESETRHCGKYALYREAGVRDIIMRVRTMAVERIHHQDEIQWYANFMSPHAGEVIISTKSLKLPAFVHSDRDDIGLYMAEAVKPSMIPELMLTANFRRNAQPLLQAVWCDQSDSFVFVGTATDLEEDQAYEVQLASFEADLRIQELLEGYEKREAIHVGEGSVDASDEQPLARRVRRAPVEEEAAPLPAPPDEQAVEVVDSM